MNTVGARIADAEALLPGVSGPEGSKDPRWQAIIKVAEFIPTHPAEVWAFVAKWGRYPDSDLRAAVATCALEHLLEMHFDTYFPMAANLARSDRGFAETVQLCWKFGQSEDHHNAAAFDALVKEVSHAV
jgi:hypothetical protein